MHKTQCEVFRTTKCIGKKWTVAILQEIDVHEDTGFNVLFKRLDKITPKILSQRLKELEEQGIIQKKSSANKNVVRTQYCLTKKGKDLYALVEQIKQWQVQYGGAPADCLERDCATCPLF